MTRFRAGAALGLLLGAITGSLLTFRLLRWWLVQGYLQGQEQEKVDGDA